MRLTREAVLKGAFAILDGYGLADLTMRRLAAELGVQPGGLYWHFANKQTLLAAMADAITAGVGPTIDVATDDNTDDPATDAIVTDIAADTLADPAAGTEARNWRVELTMISRDFRRALLVHRDGAELVAAGYALRPGSGQPMDAMIKVMYRAGLPDAESRAAAAALTHFVLGHAAEVQAHDQLRRAGALPPGQDSVPDPDAAFTVGLSIFLDGLAARRGAATCGRSSRAAQEQE